MRASRLSSKRGSITRNHVKEGKEKRLLLNVELKGVYSVGVPRHLPLNIVYSALKTNLFFVGWPGILF